MQATPQPESRKVPASWLTTIYSALGGANYVIVAMLAVNNPARQVASGFIALVGAIALLLYVRYRLGGWSRSRGFAFGVLGGALLLATPLVVDPTPQPPIQRQLIAWAGVVVVTVLVAVSDKYRASRG